MKKLAFGIDLGTTNSCIATVLPGSESSTVIPVAGNKIVPSCVLFHPDGTTTVGKEAYKRRHRSDVVYSAKRYMGTDHVFHLTLDDGSTKDVTPVDVAAEVLKYIADNVPSMYGKVEDVVITVPAYFTSEQRKATAEAGARAGLNVLRIINEPTAAAMTYGVNHKQENDTLECIIVDVGGGTTDITKVVIGYVDEINPILEGVVEKGYNFTTLSTGGNNFLGGDDFDNLIFEQFKASAMKLYPDLTEEHFKEKEKVYLLEVENAKIDILSRVAIGVAPEALKIQFAIKDDGITKEDDVRTIVLETDIIMNAFTPFFSDILECIKECAYNKETESLEIPKVCIPVGGSTKNPFLKLALQQLYADSTGSSLDLIIPSNEFADESVAQGAGLYANACINPEESNIRIREVNPIPVGIGYWDDTMNQEMFSPIIPKDSLLPVVEVRSVSTSFDNQTEIMFPFYQGTSEIVKYNKSLGNLIVPNIKPAPAGEESVLLQISIDINGVIDVVGKYGDELYELQFDSVLGVTDTAQSLSPMHKLLLQRVTKALEYYQSIGAEEELAVVRDYNLGDPLPECISRDAVAIRTYFEEKVSNAVLDTVEGTSFFDETDEDE